MRKLLIVLLLAGCASVPETNQVAAVSESIDAFGQQIDRAQRVGWISNETEDKLLDQLIEANGYLRPGAIIPADCVSMWVCVDNILLDIENKLIEAERNQ